MAKKKTPLPSESSPQKEMSVRDRLFAISRSIANVLDLEATDQELLAIVDEQFVSPTARAQARYHRRANETVCQRIETDQRFIDAVEVAKGGVF